jgi:hypothetical protein
MLKQVGSALSLGAFCLSISGCAPAGPAAPSLIAMPSKGKSYGAFQRNDEVCQRAAQRAIGGRSPGDAANESVVGGALVGTALGALAGAAIGSGSGQAGTGAAIGAGAGLLTGSVVGTGNARRTGGAMQARYDTVYAQCMSAKGNKILPDNFDEPDSYVYERPAPVYVVRRPYEGDYGYDEY